MHLVGPAGDRVFPIERHTTVATALDRVRAPAMAESRTG
jgi:hypothetical protein